MIGSIKTIAVCGAGTMGCGIALVTAMAGYKTLLLDVQEEALFKAKATIEADLQKLLTKQKISEVQKEAAMQNLQTISHIKETRANLIIEAIIEKEEIKIELLQKLAEINKPECLLATNTSSLSVTRLARQIQHPQRVIGLHFFNPAPLMKLVEIVTTEFTNDEIVQQAARFINTLSKTSVICNDAPGFIVNRVARPFYIEALRLAEEGMPFEIIDRVLEDKGFKLGPFKLMDLIGNDVNYAVSCSVYKQLNKPERLKPSFIQEEKVIKNELGKKTGKGYYSY